MYNILLEDIKDILEIIKTFDKEVKSIKKYIKNKDTFDILLKINNILADFKFDYEFKKDLNKDKEQDIINIILDGLSIIYKIKKQKINRIN